MQFPFSQKDPRFQTYIYEKAISDPGFMLTDVYLNWADVVVIQRPSQAEFVTLIENLKKAGKTVIIEIDDLIPLPKECKNNPAYPGLNANSPQAKDFIRGISAAHGVITSSETLKNHYKQWNSNILVARNAIDPDYEGYTHRNKNLQLIEAKKQHMRDKGLEPVVVFWSGGSSHFDDLRPMAQGIEWAARENPNMLFALAGNVEFYNLFAAIPDAQRCWLEFFAGQHAFYEAQSYPSVADIQLCPLPNNIFNNCKTALKGLEAGYFGNALVASDVHAYREFHQLGSYPNSLLVKNCWKPEEWRDNISKLVKDTEFRNKVVENCKKTCETHFNIESLAKLRYDFIWKLSNNRDMLVNQAQGSQFMFVGKNKQKKR